MKFNKQKQILKIFLASVAFFFAINVYNVQAALTLSDTGTGINRMVTVESTEQFRLVFEAADNWGIAKYYDLVNDPSAITNLTDENLGQPGWAVESGLLNQVFDPTSNMPDYATANDAKSFMYAAAILQPNTPRSFDIIENTASRIVVKATYFPIIASYHIAGVQCTITYYIYPDGKIYLHNTFENLTSSVYTFYDFRPMYLGLKDQTDYNSAYGWVRSSNSQSPYSYTQSQATYMYAFWNPATPAPYNTFTKASFLLIPKSDNVYRGWQMIHSWPGYKRCGFYLQSGSASVPVVSIGANATIFQEYLLQLGTQNSSVLPNIINAFVADPIANAYQANSTPPSDDLTAPAAPSGLGVV